MTTTMIPVKDLFFDRNNPRLPEYGLSSNASTDEIIKVLWEAMDVKELIQSITASGFFPHEPLIVAEENGRKVVIEGNRRLAAVHLLLDPKLSKSNGWKIPSISSQAKDKLKELPVEILSRADSWRFLGFKHVNGPAKWSSYAKAKYIADVCKTHNISLSEIAEQIGDNHGTVQNLYRGLMVLEQAEREKVYDRDDRFNKRLAFSHLTTGLGYKGISTFLSIEPKDAESDSPVPTERLEQLGEFFVWLYGSKTTNQQPVVKSQNPHLRQLDAVLQNREAKAALRSGMEITSAFEISRPSFAIFEEALLEAKRALQKAQAQLTTGYDKSEGLLKVAELIADIANDLYVDMERKRMPPRRRRRTSGGE